LKINFGAIRAIGVRTAQIMAYESMIATPIFAWLEMSPPTWFICFVVLTGCGWFFFDWKVVWPQEQAFALKNNSEFQDLKKMLAAFIRPAPTDHFRRTQDD